MESRFPAYTLHRRGFTLVEVVVSIGIVGLLTALLLPAVQSVRESARHSTCSSNVRQVITAFHEHEHTHGVFPGALFEFEPWSTRILPYLEQQKPNRLSDGQLVGGPDGVPVMACPSDPEARGDTSLGMLSYDINGGHGDSRRDGVYCTESFEPTKVADVSDGLSTTVAVAERLVMPDLQTQMMTEFDAPIFAYRLIRKTDNFIADFDKFAEYCEANSHPPKNTIVQASAYNHIQTPNRLSCTNGDRNDPRSREYMAVTTTSLHSGGVNVGVLDGTVRFVSDGIDRNVWRAVGTRNGNETSAGAAF